MPLTEDNLKNLSAEELMELQKKNCVFCQIGSGKLPAKTVFEDDTCMAFLDINPANLGHMLLVPKEHFAVMPQIPDAVTGHLFRLAKMLSVSALRAFRVKGTTIFVANGMAAGQKAPHVMVHIIPRAFDDGIDLSIPANVTADEQRGVRDALRKYLGKEPEASKGMPEKKSPKKKVKRNQPESNATLDDVAELFK